MTETDIREGPGRVILHAACPRWETTFHRADEFRRPHA
jgi:hypothetical protein